MEDPNLKTLGISLGDTKIFIPAVRAPVTLIYPGYFSWSWLRIDAMSRSPHHNR